MSADEWVGYSPQVTPIETRDWVARYRVVGCSAQTWSTLAWNDTILASLQREAVARPPSWCPFPWPSVVSPTRDQGLINTLTFLKLAAFFTFGADVPMSRTSDHAAIAATPIAAVASYLSAIQHLPPGPISLLAAEATIWNDGSCDGGGAEPSVEDAALAAPLLARLAHEQTSARSPLTVKDRDLKQLALRDLARCLRSGATNTLEKQHRR